MCKYCDGKPNWEMTPCCWRDALLAFGPSVIVALLILLVVISGCGAAPQQGGGVPAPSPAGYYVDATLEDHFMEEFSEVAACMGMGGEPQDITVVLMPFSFPCPYYNGSCSGEFVPPNTIKLGHPLYWKHEVVHYLLFLNEGYADTQHTHEAFTECGR